VLADVRELDLDGRVVHALAPDGRELTLAYDSLVVAAGCTGTYFWHDEWEAFAPGLKTLEDARHLRSHVLSAFEMAELCTDPAERAAYLTFAVVGAGPTGVEVVGQVAELAHEVLPREYRSVATTEAKILLIEAGPAVLATFDPTLQRYTQRRLQRMGVDVLLNTMAHDMDRDSVTVKDGDGERRIPARTRIWAAGVQASPLAAMLAEATGAGTDRAGRIAVSAVVESFGMKFTGVIGYTMWAFVHVLYVVGWGNRIGTILNWTRAMTFTKNRLHRTITFERAQYEVAEDPVVPGPHGG
jgi:NADH dehydrogenase